MLAGSCQSASSQESAIAAVLRNGGEFLKASRHLYIIIRNQYDITKYSDEENRLGLGTQIAPHWQLGRLIVHSSRQCSEHYSGKVCAACRAWPLIGHRGLLSKDHANTSIGLEYKAVTEILDRAVGGDFAVERHAIPPADTPANAEFA